MASTIQPEITLAVSAATNKGLVTVSSNALLLPGAVGWLYTNNGASRALIKIVTLVGTTQFSARAFPNTPNASPDLNAPPSYGLSDLSTFNGSSTVSFEQQAVAVMPVFVTPVY